MAFPTSPSANQYYTSSNGTIYQFDGVGWTVKVPDLATDGTNGTIDIAYGSGTSSVTYPVLYVDEAVAPSTNDVVTFDGDNYRATTPDSLVGNLSANAIDPTQVNFGSITAGEADSILSAATNAVTTVAFGGTAAADGAISIPTAASGTEGVVDLDNVHDGLLTGFTSGAGTLAATDSILQGFQKLDGNIANFGLTSNGNGASLIGIEDAGGNFTATDVEGALAEILSDLASNANGLGASTIGIEDSAGNVTATTVEGAIAELAAAANVSALDDLSDVDTATNASVAGDFLRFDGSNYIPVVLLTESATAPTGTDLFPGAMWNDTANDTLRIYIDNGGNPAWVNLT